MTNRSRVQEGYLLLADISGYTAFLTGTELEHAQAIMEELITLVLDHIQAPLKVIKLEGDAVFFYALSTTFLDPSRLLDLLEACYFDFADQLVNMHRATTCRCAACRAIPTLDLKFLAHYGSFLIQRLAGMEDLAGGDVILIHRLLKNHIVEETGRGAYLFLTDACLDKIDLPLGLPRHSETYEHLGAVAGGVHDLKVAWQDMVARRRVYIGSDEADLGLEYTIAAPPAVVWDYLMNPEKNLAFQDDLLAMENEPNPDGRMGIGTNAHCAHGTYSASHKYVDWRPFHYYTELVDQGAEPSPTGPPTSHITWEFMPSDTERTTLTVRARLVDRASPLMGNLALGGQIFAAHFDPVIHKLGQILAADGWPAPAPPADAE